MIPFYQRISRTNFKICFQEVVHPGGWPNRHILKILLACRHTLVAQNRGASVRLHHWGNLLMTASDDCFCFWFFIHDFLLIFATQLKEYYQILKFSGKHLYHSLFFNEVTPSYRPKLSLHEKRLSHKFCIIFWEIYFIKYLGM